MRNITIASTSYILYGIFIIIATYFAGCTSVQKGSCITPYYKSIIKNEQSVTKKLGTINISAIESDKSYSSINPETFPIRIIFYFTPLLSAIPLSDLTIKNLNCPQEGELEGILVSEIKKTGLFQEVLSQSIQEDYYLKGRINFTIDRYDHSSGFGGLLYWWLVIPPFILPKSTDHYNCEAHFEVFCTKDDKIILSKDYKFETDKLAFIFPYSSDYNLLDPELINKFIGEQIFPKIFKEFTNDIKLDIQPLSAASPN